MSDNNLEKNSAEEAENQNTENQVEAHASSNEEVAETAKEDSAKAESENVQDESANEAEAVKEAKPNNPEDFDWDSFEQDLDDYKSSDRVQLEEMYSKTLSHVDEREVVKGTIESITDRDVVVNIGFKSDGMVPLSEFKYLGEDLKPGTEVDIMVEKREDSQGQIRLSHKKALEEGAWDKIVHAHEHDEILRGYISDRTKGGMVVQLLGLDAFLPGSQIDVKPIKDYDMYVGKTLDLKVVKLNPQYRNIVVSHKAIIESDLEQQKTEILSSLEKGQVLEGVVKNLTSFGVFVDLGGVDGLIHITDVSWGRINHPEEVLELGQKINCAVLDYDEDKKRISLGLKQLTQHPWETLGEEIKEGSTVKGKIVNIEDYGAFLEISPGVEGLIHVSEMSWSTHLKSPQEYVNLGDEVEAVVLTIDREERKLALGMKQLSKDPWEGIEERYPVNSKHEAVVRSMTNFGLFMELEEGIDGLVHISDLSWTKKYNHPAEFTKVGDKMDVVVMEIDQENRRLSLGHKQLEDDPWDTFESIFLVNTTHEAEVLRVEDRGAIVKLPYSVEAFAPNKHLAKKEKGQRIQEGETATFKVIEFDRENRRIVVSHTSVWKEEDKFKRDSERAEKQKENEKTAKDVKKLQKDISSDTLADANSVLAGLKQDMEKEERVKQAVAIKEMEEKMKTKKEEGSEEQEEAPAETTDEKKEEPKAEKKTSAKAKKKDDDKSSDESKGDDKEESAEEEK